jgi:hypothetical protein
MEKDDEQARKTRAKNLMAEIERLTTESPTTKDPAADETTGENEMAPSRPASPREFIHKRMRELDKQDKQDKPKRKR